VILTAPPNLRDQIRKSGGYAKITDEDWADYDDAMAEWRDQGRKPSS
jgi:hypothetical protein